MGICISSNKGKYGCEELTDPRIFIQKLRLLQQEINAILKQREEDSEAYEREMMVLMFKEAEWKRERKKLRDEVKKLRKSLEDREERIQKMVEKREKGLTETTSNASLPLVEQMREERARRDETVEKWKMLYLAIKNELDDLIQRTHQGTLYWRADEEDFMEELQRELKAKDETIEALTAKIASMEDETYKRKREVDILRQSLRIISSKNATSPTTPIAKSLSNPSLMSSTPLAKSHSNPSPALTNMLTELAFVN